MKKEDARREFIDLLKRHETGLELDRCALLIAAEEYPALDIDDYLARLDQLGREFQRKSDDRDEVSIRLLKLRDFLCVEIGFRGNETDYFDPQNSFLNDVIDRRLGIPITLSTVFIEVARRIELPLLGVGMPGHFIVKCHTPYGVMMLDPFREGCELTEDDCREMVSQMYGGALQFHPSFLRAVSTRQILSRMLQNLKGIYTRANDYPRLMRAVERSLLLNPDDPIEIRDRGLAYYGLSRFSRALDDLEEYLRRLPHATDRDEVRKHIGELQKLQAGLN